MKPEENKQTEPTRQSRQARPNNDVLKISFFRSFFETGEMLENDEQRGKFYAGILKYAFSNGKTIPDFPQRGTLAIAWINIKPIIDASLSKRKPGNQNANQTQTKRKSNAKQTQSYPEDKDMDKDMDMDMDEDICNIPQEKQSSLLENAVKAEEIAALHPRNTAPRETVQAILDAAEREMDKGRFPDMPSAVYYSLPAGSNIRQGEYRWRTRKPPTAHRAMGRMGRGLPESEANAWGTLPVFSALTAPGGRVRRPPSPPRDPRRGI